MVCGDAGGFGEADLNQIALVSHAVAAFAYLFLAVLLLLSWKRSAPGFWLVVASLVSLAWALTAMLAFGLFASLQPAAALLETLRVAAWVAFLISLLAQLWRLGEKLNYSFLLALAVNIVFAALVVIDLAAAMGFAPRLEQLSAGLLSLYLLARLASVVGGLALVENLYRSTPTENRWGLRTLGLGLGAVFAFDIFIYADALMFRGVNPDWLALRGVVSVFAVPMIALSAARNPAWKLDIYLSHRFVFHSLSLLASGVYLVAMAAAGYYLRVFGGDWGTLLEFSFIAASLLLFLFLVFSGRFRARMRVLIAKHFFSYRHDYRDVWLRFIGTVSGQSSALALEQRVIQAVCDIMDSPGGVLWLLDDHEYQPAARWNFRSAANGREPESSDFIRFLNVRKWTVDLNDMRRGDDGYDGLSAPSWAQDDPDMWLIVPLIHGERLIGFVVLEQPRAHRELDWEDHDLLKTVGRQVASYLAEQRSQEALSEAQQFDAFNRRFAFIMHDLKNLVSQQSLLVRNADRHAENPEFRADMLHTLRSSVLKMNDMLAKLRSVAEPARRDDVFALRPILTRIVGERRGQEIEVGLDWRGGEAVLRGDGEKIEQALAHIVQNAIDASKPGGSVEVGAVVDANRVEITVADHGWGMSEQFVRNELFKPFQSTKAAGFGIGAYESRELIRAAHGNLKVDSVENRGTTMTISLPLHQGDGAASQIRL